MLIEQAIFTSAQSDHAVGYHLVARSPGVEEKDARELTIWGPSHESLETCDTTAVSVNFFRLPSGAFCVSKTELTSVSDMCSDSLTFQPVRWGCVSQT